MQYLASSIGMQSAQHVPNTHFTDMLKANEAQVEECRNCHTRAFPEFADGFTCMRFRRKEKTHRQRVCLSVSGHGQTISTTNDGPGLFQTTMLNYLHAVDARNPDLRIEVEIRKKHRHLSSRRPSVQTFHSKNACSLFVYC